MTRNIRLLLAYDGTDFHGWQKQPGLRTVQDAVEQALRRVVRHQITLIGASRTDSGVHAFGQVANFETTREIPCDNLRRAIGGRLPKDTSLIHVCEVPLTFRACSDHVCKLYRYSIHNNTHRPVGHLRQRYTYHFWHPLDIDCMQEAAHHLIGRHDFAAFASKGSERETTVRTIKRMQVYRHYDEVHIDVEGDGFLYNQVRNIAGTLIEIGRGHWPPEKIVDILASLDRSQAGPTAPARGLCLQWIRYDPPALTQNSNEQPGSEQNVNSLPSAEKTDGDA